MALTPTFDNFSLQDSNYITTEVDVRTPPNREFQMETVSRKPGKKLLAAEFAERRMKLAGYIIADSNAQLITLIDDFHDNITRKKSGTFSVDTDREILATVASVSVPTPHYSQSMTSFDMELVAADPFFLGPQQTVSWTVTSGTASLSYTLTVSGSVFAEPTIVYTAPGTSGSTTTSGIIISYDPTAETTTWSGGNHTLAYGNFVKFDFQNLLVYEGSNKVEPAGLFPRWEPGSTTFTTTWSGTCQGGSLDLIYRPRYL
ncbi:MAG: hypothetical protein WC549_00590 [Actinomycetota bacterium]